MWRSWQGPMSPCCCSGESGTGKEALARATARPGARGPGSRSSRSIAARSPRTCSRANCSAMSGAPSRVRSSRRRVGSRRRIAGHCSSMRSGTCRTRCRSSCCDSCRTSGWSASAVASRSRWTCAWCPPPIRCCRTRSTAGAFRSDLFYRLNPITVRIPPVAGAGRRCGAARTLLPGTAFNREFGKRGQGLVGRCVDRAGRT